MALTITSIEVQRLAAEVARLTGESQTQAIRVALEERRARLAGGGEGQRGPRLASGIDPAARTAALLEFMEQQIWAHVPVELRGQPHDQARDDEIVRYGSDGLPG